VLCIIELEFDWSCCMKWHETGATHDGMGSPIEATSISPTSADIPGSSVPFHGMQKISGQETVAAGGNSPRAVNVTEGCIACVPLKSA